MEEDKGENKDIKDLNYIAEGKSNGCMIKCISIKCTSCFFKPCISSKANIVDPNTVTKINCIFGRNGMKLGFNRKILTNKATMGLAF